jgi:hypothetical protein
MYYPFYIFILLGPGSVNELFFMLGDWITRKDKRIIIRMVTPPGIRTSPLINWLNR